METQNKEKKNSKMSTEKRTELQRYITIAAVILMTACLGMLFFFVLYRYDSFSHFFKKLGFILQPIIIGLVLAYLLNPVMVFLEKYLLKLLDKRMKTRLKERRLARTLATMGSVLFLLLVIFLLLEMIIPQLVESIQNMILSLPKETNSFLDWASKTLDGDNFFIRLIRSYVLKGMDDIENFIQTQLLPLANTYIASLTQGVINIIKLLFNFVIGVIVSAYVLMSKETFIGQSKKLIYTILPAKAGNTVVTTFRKSHKIFGGFISGKILDSAIIGILCYILLLLTRMPYSLLVAVVIGATNIIPFFGPFIGAVPCFVLIGLENPVKGLYFLILIVVLQQFDGNILGPKILGNSTGLSPFWVIFAILAGGGLFGFAGMLLGVPTFAVIYHIINEVVAYILRRKKLPESTREYIRLDQINEISKDIELINIQQIAENEADELTDTTESKDK